VGDRFGARAREEAPIFALHFGNWVWKWENRDRTFLYLFANLNELWNIRLEKKFLKKKGWKKTNFT
jgi:hypothetical protein